MCKNSYNWVTIIKQWVRILSKENLEKKTIIIKSTEYYKMLILYIYLMNATHFISLWGGGGTLKIKITINEIKITFVQKDWHSSCNVKITIIKHIKMNWSIS